MEKDSFELSPELAAESGHCDNTSEIPTEIASPPLQALPGGYDASRFNALRHGVLSAYTVLPWEDKAEYEALLSAFVKEHAPDGPTEEHLVEEIAGVLWRKRRLRIAEGASYRRGLEEIGRPSLKTRASALIKVEPLIDQLTKTLLLEDGDFPELKRREASARTALAILSAGKAGAYEAALAELDESTGRNWEFQITPGPEDEDQDQDEEGFPPDATGLAEYLNNCVLPPLAAHFGYVENQHLIREQVLGEAFPCTRLEKLSRYEVHLDRKLERMLAMLLRLQSRRQSSEAS